MANAINSLNYGNNIYTFTLPYGVCETVADTAAKTVTVDNFSLETGAVVIVKFTYANSVASPTLNVNGTGAKAIMRYGTTATSTGTTTTGWVAGAVQMFTYDGTNWIRDYWNNTTYSNAGLGQGYATCSTAAATTAKVGTLSSYSLTTGGIVSVKFSYDVPASATLNINSKGAKSIYFRGAAITAGVIKAGDIATFIYSSQYHLISIDRWQNDINNAITGLSVSGKTITYTKGNGTTGTITTQDTDTVYTHPTYTARTGKPTANQTPAFGGTATVSQITSDASGHVTGVTDRTITIPSTLSNGTGTAGLIKTTSTVTSNSGYTACPVISGVPYYKDTNTTYSLSSFGITATAAELNYTDGVTSNIQTQLNGKSPTSHTHDKITSGLGSWAAMYFDDATNKNHWFKPDVDYPTNKLINLGSDTTRTWDNVYAGKGMYVGDKAYITSTSEGGNIRITSPNGVYWEMDAYDDNFRLYSNNGTNVFPLSIAASTGYVTFNKNTYFDQSSNQVGLRFINSTTSSYHVCILGYSKATSTNNAICMYDTTNGRNVWTYDAKNNQFNVSAATLGATGDILLTTGNLKWNSSAHLASPTSKLLYIGASSETGYRLLLGVRDSAWRITPETSGYLQIGSGNYRFGQIYSTNSSISTSDRTLKKGIKPLSDVHLKFFTMLQPVSFQFIDGTSGRTHIGFIAQDVEDAMFACGLSDLDFAGFCKDQKCESVKKTRKEEREVEVPKEVEVERIDEKTGEVYTITEIISEIQTVVEEVEYLEDVPIEGEYIYSLRYEEFIALVTQATQYALNKIEVLEDKMSKFEERLSALESK